eukprot:CAMPEP_0205900046 /NCGR_PEP_ID=MMETSP1083-20121108/26941_1 /ASSEMBLY_ACC=CAM_ASM_000430 /TAXON_ID=97485 /ORGANISM="Prymnesium parvum, Strain Texoma1" /LENGTH=40 /DNA_ID= /DNA_START= /DNA_END= /DNA_ORIENTATION=
MKKLRLKSAAAEALLSSAMATSPSLPCNLNARTPCASWAA